MSNNKSKYEKIIPISCHIDGSVQYGFLPKQAVGKTAF